MTDNNIKTISQEHPFWNNLEYDYRQIFLDAIMNFIKIKGEKYNQGCNWSNDKIFDMLDQMELFDQKTLAIPNNKFYTAANNYNKNYYTVIEKDGHYVLTYDDSVLKSSENSSQLENLQKYKSYKYHLGGWCSQIGHVLPTKEIIAYLTPIMLGKTTISLGSGLGLWEHLLQNNGCKIICTDIEIYAFTYSKIIEVNCSETITIQLMRNNVIKSLNEIDILFMIWSEPDRNCNCCKYCKCSNNCGKKISKIDPDYSWYCEHGYDSDTLSQCMPPIVIVISDDSIDDYGMYTVCSKACRFILQENYILQNKLLLPFNKDDDCHPYLQIWIRKI